MDILVSNAAVNPTFGPVFDGTEEVWDKIFDVNVKSTFFLMKESLPLLKCSKSPSIIIVSSIAGYQPINVSLFKFWLMIYLFYLLEKHF